MNSCNQALGWCRVASVTSPPALSLRKDTSPPALPDMTSGERAVVDQIKQCAIMDDLVKVSINLPRAQTEALGKDIKTFMRRIAENGTPKRLTTVELGSSLSIGEYRVAFCSVADGNLIIGVATLGVDPTPPTGTKKVDTVKIKIDDESSTKVQYHIYSVADGRDTIAKQLSGGELSTDHRYNELVQFVTDMLKH